MHRPHGQQELVRSTRIDWQQRRVRHGKSRIDARLSHLFASITNATTEAAFWSLVHVVRQRSRLLDPTCLPKSGEPQLDALHHLAQFAEQFLAQPSDWPGCSGSVHDVIASLAQHLLGKYPVPRVLSSVWFGDSSARARQRRRWYVEHASGRKLRELDIQLELTRTMEKHFMSSPHDLTVEQALRRAELMGLGAEADYALRICRTRIGRDLSHAPFWRSVAHFFVNVANDIDAKDIGPIVDFLHAVRIQRIEVLTANGVEYLDPPQPNFSVKGRSLASMLRLVEQWHHSLQGDHGGTWTWQPSSCQPWLLRRDQDPEDPVFWELVELTSSRELAREGYAMQHCVLSYARDCTRGRSRIWSLRSRRDQRVKSMLTIELNPHRREIVQIRGKGNRMPRGEPLQFLQQWAKREGLQIIRQAMA